MKKLLNIKSGRTQALLLVLALSLVTGFQNCAPGTLSTSSTTFTANDSSITAADQVAYQTNYSENVLTSMLTVTGVNANSTTLASYQNAKARISDTGVSTAVTAPMWLAITNLAGDVCENLVTQELALTAANRSFFGQVDFTQGPSKVSTAIQNDVVRRMARAYWGRNETPQELAMVESETVSAFTGQTDNGQMTQNEMLFMCTAMLATLDSQKL